MRLSYSKLTGMVLITLMGAVSGCSLMGTGLESLLTRLQSQEKSGKSILRPLSRSQDAVRLEVFFVERPRKDPLFGELLWRDIAPIGNLSTDVRDALQASGFRVGHTGSSPPPALETLLGFRTELADDGTHHGDRRLTHKSLNLLADSETQVQTSRNFSKLDLDSFLGENGDQEKTFENARCLFRIKARKLQDGWATFEFQPEIHHGQYGWRPVFSETGLSGATSQVVHPIFSHTFSVSLNQGEMVVLSADGNDPNSLASKFFQAPGDISQMQRMLIIRLTDLPKVDLAYAE